MQVAVRATALVKIVPSPILLLSSDSERMRLVQKLSSKGFPGASSPKSGSKEDCFSNKNSAPSIDPEGMGSFGKNR